ncbi:MAG: UDP-N-acetylglucosamine 2-epimerase (non-hydrolyzing) [Bacteroidia bacterium]|nr:UDP-N-acetylglucosamine 2-epimerase (non-hydrolyzing) [Bacteroidia bacterium]
MKNIITILGARPQFIKAATLSKALDEHPEAQEILIHTGQHFDSNMSEIFFNQMSIPEPKYNLAINNLGHGAMTGEMLKATEKILLDEKPDLVVVYGDTNSTLAGALAATKLHIPVAHVEAGLRSFNMHMPEEINRILTDRISSFLFCPTEAAINNLHNEGFKNFDVIIKNVGDVMFDACRTFALKAKPPQFSDPFILVTIHRAENTNDPSKLKAIVEALNILHQEIKVVIPLHPRTAQYLKKYGLTLKCAIVEPVGYLEMLGMLQKAKAIVTDSGGLQKEAYFHSKSCVTIRDQTEWVELVECGANILSSTNTAEIVQKVRYSLEKTISLNPILYGDGHAVDKIVNLLL